MANDFYNNEERIYRGRRHRLMMSGNLAWLFTHHKIIKQRWFNNIISPKFFFIHLIQYNSQMV